MVVTKAFVLINTKPGSESSVTKALLKKPEVKDLNVVYGEFDIVMKIETPDMKSLQTFIMGMRTDKNIDRTSTMICTE